MRKSQKYNQIAAKVVFGNVAKCVHARSASIILLRVNFLSVSRFVYGVTIFLGAFLLFLVEPMAAKELLPVLGGSSAV